MAKLTIIKEPNEILRKRSKEVTEFGPRLHQLLDDLKDTMQAAAGVGIAAVQVGILFRVCLVNTDDFGIVELVNPSLVKAMGKKSGEEGCLSVPNHHGMIIRPTKVTVRAQDRNGISFEHTFEGRSAVCVSHELDHLDGVLFVDRLTRP